MKNILVLLAVLSAATLSYAGDTTTCTDKAKCTDKSGKACCCKSDKACCTDKAKCTDKSDKACCCKGSKDAAKPAPAPAK